MKDTTYLKVNNSFERNVNIIDDSTLEKGAIVLTNIWYVTDRGFLEVMFTEGFSLGRFAMIRRSTTNPKTLIQTDILTNMVISMMTKFVCLDLDGGMSNDPSSFKRVALPQVFSSVSAPVVISPLLRYDLSLRTDSLTLI